eukprot:CAMPEP_0172087406 /NCGR_PEP_ID=MMETSP1043-20130122/22663_1 /TAXON_ID=464988 /ORGANISM="Hemiselmis andersenii, Strain CCMP441" /LENGTH=35 /DNA_ID= /DNA_START= /DNA_END= /DNA_ORIENTATION=
MTSTTTESRRSGPVSLRFGVRIGTRGCKADGMSAL